MEDENFDNEIHIKNLLRAKFNTLKITNDGYIFLNMFFEDNFPRRIETIQNYVPDQKEVFFKLFHHNFVMIFNASLNVNDNEIIINSGSDIRLYIDFIKALNNNTHYRVECIIQYYDQIKFDITVNFLRDLGLII